MNGHGRTGVSVPFPYLTMMKPRVVRMATRGRRCSAKGQAGDGWEAVGAKQRVHVRGHGRQGELHVGRWNVEVTSATSGAADSGSVGMWNGANPTRGAMRGAGKMPVSENITSAPYC